jgi:hypothetical protein
MRIVNIGSRVKGVGCRVKGVGERVRDDEDKDAGTGSGREE